MVIDSNSNYGRGAFNMTKKSIPILLAVIIMIVMSLGNYPTAYAAEVDNEISPQMSYISTILPTLSLSRSTASLNCEVRGIQGITTKITVTGTLQRYVSGGWVDVSSSSQTSNYYRMIYTRSTSVISGYSYRAKYMVKAYAGSAYETRTVYSKTITLS